MSNAIFNAGKNHKSKELGKADRGFAVLLHYGITVLRYCGIAALRYYGITVLRYFDVPII